MEASHRMMHEPPGSASPPPGGHRLEAILFDLFHTLVDLRDVPSGTSTPELLGIDPDAWSRKVVEDSPHHALGTEADPVESVRMIAHAIDPSIPMEKIITAVKLRPRRFRTALLGARREVLAMLAHFKELGLRMALVSNAGLDEVSSWDDSPLAPFFEAALFSCHERVMKPEPEIYQRAAKLLGARPANCLFVGDGGSREHEGAAAVGMHTVLLLVLLRLSYPEVAARRPRNTTWICETFGELSALIDRLHTDGLPAAR